MGTSSARKAPVGNYWRTAKTMASRFAAGKEASPPSAQEVVARYLVALESTDPKTTGGTKPFLPDLVQTAASLGNFYRRWEQAGWGAALESLGLNPDTFQTRETILPALLDKLAGPGARLEEAVARAALIDQLGTFLSAGEHPARTEVSSGPDCPDSMARVREFLGTALYRKLLSDLGEPLEFHAPSPIQGLQRQEELKSHILANLGTPATALTTDEAFSVSLTERLLEDIITLLGGRHER